jgi:hypothetical protein
MALVLLVVAAAAARKTEPPTPSPGPDPFQQVNLSHWKTDHPRGVAPKRRSRPPTEKDPDGGWARYDDQHFADGIGRIHC